MSIRMNAVGAIASVLLLAGCQAETTTSVDVHEDLSTAISVSTTVDGELAEQFAAPPALSNQMTSTYETYLGVTPEGPENVDGTLVWAATGVPFAQVVAASDVLGIAGATVDASPDDNTATVNMDLVQPAQLEDAIRTATADQEDAVVLADTMLDYTVNTVSIRFPGDVTAATFTPKGGASVALTTDGDTFTFSRTLNMWEPGTLTVTGNTSGSSVTPIVVGGTVVFAGVVLGLLFVGRRRRNSDQPDVPTLPSWD